MKLKILFVALALMLVAIRLPAIIGLNSPMLGIAYNSAPNTVTITGTGAQPFRMLYLYASTNLAGTNWTLVATNKVLGNGICTFTNVPATNPCSFFRSNY